MGGSGKNQGVEDEILPDIVLKEDQHPAPFINCGSTPTSAIAVALPAQRDWPVMCVLK